MAQTDHRPKLAQLYRRHPELAPLAEETDRACVLLEEAFAAGRKLLLCGNGGSASDAQHVAGEMMKGFLERRPLPAGRREALLASCPAAGPYLADHLQSGLPAIALDGHGSLLTAVANDNGGDLIFAQQVEALGTSGDILWAFSTSGNSRNVILACIVARSLGLGVIGMTGEAGGELVGLCDVCLRVPARETFLVQEYHLPLYHAVCAAVEETFFGRGSEGSPRPGSA